MKYTIKNNRVYNKDNEVAVIYSPHYGAGWSTWNTNHPSCLFDPDCVFCILKGDRAELAVIAQLKWDDFYMTGNPIEIQWLPAGVKFRVLEYDGKESFQFYNDVDWVVA